MSRFRALLAALLLTVAAFGACSAEGGVSGGEDGDGVKIEGDVDADK